MCSIPEQCLPLVVAVISSNIKSKLYIHLTCRPPRPSPSHATSTLSSFLSKQVTPQGDPPPIQQDLEVMSEGKEFPALVSEGLPHLPTLPLLAPQPRAKSQDLVILGSEPPSTLVYTGYAGSEANGGRGAWGFRCWGAWLGVV